jgi:DNA-binding response OmpR family regulator
MTKILAVDDEFVNLMIIEETLSQDGYTIVTADDGESAWQKMHEQTFDLIILDRVMPRLDGLELLKRIKANPQWQAMPVIMQTAAGTQQQVLEGIEAGAYYYLTKPYKPKVLSTLVKTVVTELTEKIRLAEASSQLFGMLALFERGELRFRTLDEARSIAAGFGALCRQISPSADVGLLELLINSVEHGNLGITYDEKSTLRMEDRWEQEVEQRLKAEPWASRSTTVRYSRSEAGIELTITDEGDGFDWQRYLTFDPDRAFDSHGRGIAMANLMSFSSLEYQGKGNVVVARINKT